MLSNKAYKMLADVLAPRIANELQSSERFIEILHEVVPDLIVNEIGECDDEVLFELALTVMDRIYIKTQTLP
jgi:hypothetical protein